MRAINMKRKTWHDVSIEYSVEVCNVICNLFMLIINKCKNKWMEVQWSSLYLICFRYTIDFNAHIDGKLLTLLLISNLITIILNWNDFIIDNSDELRAWVEEWNHFNQPSSDQYHFVRTHHWCKITKCLIIFCFRCSAHNNVAVVDIIAKSCRLAVYYNSNTIVIIG